ncbi:MAG TPA: hypothetical protein VFP14_05325 [Novosphingobium sp.]|nr:hypothetical protein [Novosphingobium sp.]
MTKKLLVALGAVAVVIGAGSATAVTWGSSSLLKNPPDCSLAINATSPFCANQVTTYTSAG